MKKTFFGFALADAMFATDCVISRRTLSIDEVTALVEQGVEPCLNPSHTATIAAMRERFGIDVLIPETPPQVALAAGDSLIVMGVRGLPRLTDRHEYTEEEVASATFSFSVYTVAPAFTSDELESADRWLALAEAGYSVCADDDSARLRSLLEASGLRA